MQEKVDWSIVSNPSTSLISSSKHQHMDPPPHKLNTMSIFGGKWSTKMIPNRWGWLILAWENLFTKYIPTAKLEQSNFNELVVKYVRSSHASIENENSVIKVPPERNSSIKCTKKSHFWTFTNSSKFFKGICHKVR